MEKNLERWYALERRGMKVRVSSGTVRLQRVEIKKSR